MKYMIPLILLVILSACGSSSKYEVSMEMGQDAFEDGRYEDAFSAFQMAMKEDPDSTEALEWLMKAKKEQDEVSSDSDETVSAAEQEEAKTETVDKPVATIQRPLEIVDEGERYLIQGITLGMSLDELVGKLGDPPYKSECTAEENMDGCEDPVADYEITYPIESDQTDQHPILSFRMKGDKVHSIYFHYYEDIEWFGDPAIMNHSLLAGVEQIYHPIDTDYAKDQIQSLSITNMDDYYAGGLTQRSTTLEMNAGSFQETLGFSLEDFLIAYHHHYRAVYNQANTPFKQKMGHDLNHMNVYQIRMENRGDSSIAEFAFNDRAALVAEFQYGEPVYIGLREKPGEKIDMNQDLKTYETQLNQAAQQTMESMIVMQTMIRATNQDPEKIMGEFYKQQYQQYKDTAVVQFNGLVYKQLKQNGNSWFVIER